MEDGLIDFFTYIGIMRDPGGSYDMVPDEVITALPPRPDIVDLELRWEELKSGWH